MRDARARLESRVMLGSDAAWPASSPRLASRSRAAAAVALLIALFVVVRACIAFVRPENSDESQHLHVAWAIAHGAVPYLDVFDNHAPLAALLYAPVVAAIGERADIVSVMRLTMIPWAFASLLLVAYIGRRLWSSRVGAWAAAIAATAPVVLGTSVEFRPDVLWASAWLAVVATLVSPMPVMRRGVLAGALVGVTFAVSLKTMLLAACAVLAGAALLVGARRTAAACRPAAAGVASALAVAGVVVVSLGVVGAARAAAYCLVTHNLVTHLGHWRHAASAIAALPLGIAACLVLIYGYAKRHAHDPRALWRCFVVASAVLYLVCLYGAWPLVTHQDLLPAAPLLALGIAASIDENSKRRAWVPLTQSLVAATVAVCVANVATSLLEDPSKLRYVEARRERALRLTRIDTPVLDAKGFTVFRPRPVYWVLESVTRSRMRDGSIEDTTAASLAGTATPVVIADDLPSRDRTFVADNYLCTDDGVFVAGKRIAPEASGARHFSVAIALAYRVLGEDGAAPPIIDGRAVEHVVQLGAGPHTLELAGSNPVYLVWAGALPRSQSGLVVRDFSACWHEHAT